MASAHPVGSSVHTPLVPSTGCIQRTTGSCATNLLEAPTEGTGSSRLHSTSRAALSSQDNKVLQRHATKISRRVSWLPWSLPYVVWSGLHELMIPSRGLRRAHRQASITVSCVVSAFLLLHVRLHTNLTGFLHAAILCCKHTAWSLEGRCSPG